MADHPRVEGFDAARLAALPPGPFMEGLAFTLDLLSPDRLEAHVDVDERHHQPYGIVHGGVYAAIVETMGSIGGALRVAADGDVVVGVANATDFLRAHRQGRLDAVAEPVHVGRTQQLWQVEIRRPGDGRMVARGQLRLQVVPGDRPLAGRAAGTARRDEESP